MKITVEMDIDFTLLREQKRDLVRIVCKLGSETVEGMLALLDHIQDSSVSTGQASEEEVFGRNGEEEDGRNEEEEESDPLCTCGRHKANCTTFKDSSVPHGDRWDGMNL